MEAKVDIRKLQLLNDRINQTIDALNQVRMSVHGLAHTSGVPFGVLPQQQFGIPGLGYPQTPGYGTIPGIGVQGMQQPFAPWQTTQFGGLSHTSPELGDPWAAVRFGADPYAAVRIASDPWITMRYVQSFPNVLAPFVPYMP